MNTADSNTIELKLSEEMPSVLLDLNELFACQGLDYQVATESYGVIEATVLQKRGMLRIQPGEYAHAGALTRLALRATDAGGDSVLVTWTVVVVADVDAELLVA